MAAGDQQVIVKKKYVQAEGHHGGAWKVAYADFVTAMMAFFLLLWLLNAVEQEVLEGISNYFTPTLQSEAAPSGAGGVFGGVTASDPGPVEKSEQNSGVEAMTTTMGRMSSPEEGKGPDDAESTGDTGEVDYEREERQFNTAKQLLENAVDELPPALQHLEQMVKVDVTREGLRIQIVDNNNRESFKPGTAELTEDARKALTLISQYIERLPNRLSITGHTDASDEESRDWPLSLARANATRRALVERAVPSQRFETVIGKADTELRVPEEPTAPQNRRMAIVLLRRADIPEGSAYAPSILDAPAQ